MTDHHARLQRLEKMAHRMDSAIRIPVIGLRVGYDSIIGMIPGVGDLLTLAPSAWIIYESKRLGAPAHVISRMVANTATDTLVGMIPLIGDLFDATSVSQSVAGMDAVICLYDSPSLATASGAAANHQPHDLYQAVDALLSGLPKVGVERLVLVADLSAKGDDPTVTAALQRIAAHPLKWTLVDANADGDDLSIEDFSVIDDLDSSDRRVQLRRIAAGIVDELETPQHLHEQIHFRI